MDSCSTKPRNFTRPFEDYRKAARMATEVLQKQIEDKGSITWNRVLEVTERDSLVFKLCLKYLRENGYNIGNNTRPFITKPQAKEDR